MRSPLALEARSHLTQNFPGDRVSPSPTNDTAPHLDRALVGNFFALKCHCLLSSATIILILLFKKALCQKLHDFTESSSKFSLGIAPPPHFHAVYGEYNALIGIESLQIIEGDLPNRAEKLVVEWAILYQKELLAMWNSQEFRKLPPLK